MYMHRYKYLTAYTPLVRFYYRGKAIYRFKATESYDELLEQVTIMTGTGRLGTLEKPFSKICCGSVTSFFLLRVPAHEGGLERH